MKVENSEEVKNSIATSENFVLTHEIVKPLKCSFCSLYLSYPPIFMTTQEDVRYKCGRCSVKTRFNFRDLMYEELAKHMKFPCIYKNCTETIAWDNVRDHEKECKYRTLACMASDCHEQVLEKEFASHFKEKHKKMYHFDKIVLENMHSGGGICILEKDDRCYVFLYDTNIEKFRMCLCGIQGIDKQFEITFKSKDSKNSIFMTEHNIVNYNDRVHCYRCLKGDCKYEYHMYCHYRKGMLKYANGKIDKDILKRSFGNDITCIITVVDEKAENENDDELDDLLMSKDVVIDEVTEEDEAEEEKPLEPVKTDVIKDLLKCPSCENQLSEPIFQCLEGHAVCKDCKAKAEDSKCSSCEAKIDSTRNYIVEEAITNLKLNKQELDDSKEIICPMSKCHETVKLFGISNHFKESHIENFHFNKVVLKNIYGYYNVNVLVKNGKTFLLFFDFDDFNFGISVCAVDGDEDLYEVKLLSDNKKYYLLANDQKIIKFNDKEHCFKCSIGTCKITDHTFRVKRKEIFRRLTTKLNRDCIRRAFKSSTLTYHINIKTKEIENKTDKVIRQLCECPICKDYMVPPIHQCVAGHTLCNVCKSKVKKCPSCEGNLEETRNFILENISEAVELPCSFESKSCPFRGGVKRMASHELECPLNNKKQCVDSAADDKKEPKVEPMEATDGAAETSGATAETSGAVAETSGGAAEATDGTAEASDGAAEATGGATEESMEATDANTN